MKGKTIHKHLLSPEVFTRWMDENSSLVASEEEKTGADKTYTPRSIKDSDVLLCLEDKPICNLCVYIYKRLAMMDDDDSSEGDTATPVANGRPKTQKKMKPTEKKKETGVGNGVEKKEKKHAKLTELDLTKHLVSERVPWMHFAEYPAEQLKAQEFVTKSHAGDQN